MIHRRGVLPVLALLVLVVAGAVLQIVRAPAAGAPAPPPDASAPVGPSPAERAVLRSLGAVERAYRAGDVRRLCRPGALLDPAVIRAQSRGCESRLERLMTTVPRLRVTIRGLTLRPDLATAAVRTARDTVTAVDFVRRGKRWLLSFSDGEDPFPALAGTA